MAFLFGASAGATEDGVKEESIWGGGEEGRGGREEMKMAQIMRSQTRNVWEDLISASRVGKGLEAMKLDGKKTQVFVDLSYYAYYSFVFIITILFWIIPFFNH